MADPAPTRTTGKWLWPLLIALLAILLLIWLFSPSGDTDEAQVEDPIVTPELGQEAAPNAQEIELEAGTAGGSAAEDAVTTTETTGATAPAAQ